MSTQLSNNIALTLPTNLKIAILVEEANHAPKTTEPKQRFLELAAKDVGVTIKTFIDKKIAFDWLKL